MTVTQAHDASWNPTGHERQLLAVEPLQVVQEGSQTGQVEVRKYLPGAHVRQVVAATEQVRQVASQGRQVLADRY